MIGLLQASASVVLGQVTLKESHAPLEKVLHTIEKQTGYVFLYTGKDVQSLTVSIEVSNVPVTEAVEKCLKDLPLSYKMVDKNILLKRKVVVPAVDKPVVPVKVLGKVVDTLGKPLVGATVLDKNSKMAVLTNVDGEFALNAQAGDQIAVSFIGYNVYTFSVTEGIVVHNVVLREGVSRLNEVVVSTGYQELPKERATGSFDIIDSMLINRSVSTNILDRLNGVTSGLIFNQNKQNPNGSNITIRGTSTLFANDQPLIVLDNFPYEGDLGNINPNDIQSITVLKDAAAASIWGVRAGNGVIVITTKKGKANTPPQVNFNSNITIADKPNLYYTPQLTSAQYIGVEKYLFNQGYYYNVSDGYSAISPAVAILNANQNGQLSTAQMNAQLNALANNDVRSDLGKYLYRKPVSQQYALSVAGGGNSNKYYISAGFDDNLQPLVTNSYKRVTLNANNTYSLIKNRLEWTSGIQFTQSTTKQNSNSFVPSNPYEMLKDASGNNLAVVNGLRTSYIDTAGGGKLLDWRDIPLNDNKPNQTTTLTDYRLSNQVSLKILSGLQLSAYYLYEKGTTDFNQDNTANSYYTRNLVNTYSQIDPVTGSVTQIFPAGDIVLNDNSYYTLNTGRLQLNFDRQFGSDHRLTALAGYEVSSYNSFDNSFTQYGYNPLTAVNANQSINFASDYPQFYGYNTGQIPAGINSNGTIDRNRSYFANASYSYKKRYIISASARRDESNIFGVSTNQKGVPLWSSGLAWKINQESFYHWEAMPLLSFRATYGYNGNTDKSTTAYLTAVSSGGQVNSFNAPYSVITNPPNPGLRWEKVGVTNLGLDFGLKNDLITGSIEYYIKNSTDLIANSPVAPQSGVTQFRGNSADMRTSGVDVVLNLKLLQSPFHWDAMVLFNYNKNKVTKYQAITGTDEEIAQGNYLNPLVGYPLYSIFSFPTTKLDAKGNPQGYLNGQLSEDYASIVNSANPSNITYNGSATPLYFGSIINNFRYKKIDLSIGIGYKLDYYFRKTSLNYSTLFNGFYQQADFAKRWQKPGDENTTTVPAMIYPNDPNRDLLYTYSNSLIDRADNIRLQDVKLGYTLDKNSAPGLPVKTIQFYVYANNLAILWRANHDGLDPDSPFVSPATKSIAFGVRVGF
ncbi:MAG: SusC/RagA family TonB-linked outer membrane protein [Mucilaginibacter sp.]|uniref:SusC/RagA family TonB-linked outer membrane protein n=1 Tax=Mucilaginibacter sp. TaxID=1882438 RepID=UPI0032670772